jgi:hypothetical protein
VVSKCLLIQGRCPAEYLALLPSHTARVITSARSGKLCAMDLQSDQKMGSISAHMHSCMHCGRAQSDTMVAAVHRMLQCAAMASNVAQFRIRILVRVWTGMRPRMPWCCPFCHRWEDKPSRETKVLYWNAVATLFRPLAEACGFFG